MCDVFSTTCGEGRGGRATERERGSDEEEERGREEAVGGGGGGGGGEVKVSL